MIHNCFTIYLILLISVQGVYAFTGTELGLFLGFVFTIILAIILFLYFILRKKFINPQKNSEMLMNFRENERK